MVFSRKTNYYQYWFLPVLRCRRVSTSSGNKAVSHWRLDRDILRVSSISRIAWRYPRCSSVRATCSSSSRSREPHRSESQRVFRGLYMGIGSIVKPLWQLPPSEAKNAPTSPEQRKSAQRPKFSAGRPCGHPAKNFGQALQILGKQAFWYGHAARTSTKKLRSEKLRADFSFQHFPNK